MEEGRSDFEILTYKNTRMIPLGRPGRRWEDSIRMDLKEIGTNTGIGLIQLIIRTTREPL